MKHSSKLAIGLVLSLQVLNGAAHAVPVTISGTTVDFAFDDALMGLFGQPTVTGDTLFFTPGNYKAQSANGAGFALTPETINIRATAHADRGFSSVSLSERGDYLLSGAGGTVDVAGQLRIFDAAMPAVEMTAAFSVPSPLNLVGVPTKNWLVDTPVDVSAWQSEGTLNVTIENLLLASTSEAASLAFVEKKFTGLTLTTTPMPESETYTMLLAGLGLIGFTVARRYHRADA